MRRITRLVLALATLLVTGPAFSQQAMPPHAFLFGAWTGGIFPVPAGMNREACLATPVVIFTRDVVMRATLTEVTMTQREIESARAVPGGFELRLLPGRAGGSVLGGGTSLAGFGCENGNVLHVQRRGENEIAFPGCADFPNPLVRCH
jgi:hypothetical protein